ncbi:MAG: putative zinc-binding protein [Methanospirillum sp.]
MDCETVMIAKATGKCPACEDYAERNSTTPSKIAVMACEGACARGEVARRAANLVAHRLAPDETVRICLGGAFTKDTGQRNLVRRAEKVIAIEGCFINCSSRMMAGVLPDLKPEIVRADLIYNLDLPFGIDEVPDEMFTVYAYRVAEQAVREYVTGSSASGFGTDPLSGGCGCSAPTPSCDPVIRCQDEPDRGDPTKN